MEDFFVLSLTEEGGRGAEAVSFFSLALAPGFLPLGSGFLPLIPLGLGGTGDSGILNSAPPALRCSS